MARIHVTPRKQRKTKSPVVTYSYNQVLYVYHLQEWKKSYEKIGTWMEFSFVLIYGPPLNALSLIALGKNLTTVYTVI